MPEISSQRVEKLAAAAASLAAIVDELRGAIEAPPHIRQRVEEYVRAGICLRCGEKKSGRYTRGCDVNCYNATMKEIGRGEVTEADLIQKGRITERPLPGGRKSNRTPASEIGELPELVPQRQPSQDDDEALGKFKKDVRAGKAWPDMLPGDKEAAQLEAEATYAKGRRRKGKKSADT